MIESVSLTEVIAAVVLIVTITIASMNFFSYAVMRFTEKYKDTPSKVDDKLHRRSRIVLKALEKFNKIFMARY